MFIGQPSVCHSCPSAHDWARKLGPPYPEARDPNRDGIHKCSRHCSSLSSRYFDDPMELRSSSFSSWDDGADSYWKKDSSRDPEPAMRSTGSSDRWELQAGELGDSILGPVGDPCDMRVLCSFRT